MVCLILAFALQSYIHAPFIRPIVAHFIGLPLRPSPHPAVRSLILCIICFVTVEMCEQVHEHPTLCERTK